ncbi:hypothetical protein EU528_11450, partial [Candidatus Thorarchaeota archaeon]
MSRIFPKMLILILVTGFLIVNTPLICEAVIVDQTNYKQYPFDITEPLVFSTLTGNQTQDNIICVDYDEVGDLYVAGITSDTGDNDDNCDSFLMKINGTDFSPINYTTIKGSDFDFVKDLVVDSGKIYLVG